MYFSNVNKIHGIDGKMWKSFSGIGKTLGISRKVLYDVIPEKDGRGRILEIRPPGKDDAPAAYRGGNGEKRNVLAGHPVPCDLGDERNAEPCADEFPNGVRAVAFEGNPRRETGRMAVHVCNGAETFPCLEHDESRLAEVAEIHSGERRPGIGIRHSEKDFLFQKGTGTFIIPGTDGREKGKIHGILVFLPVVNFLLENFQVDVWMETAEIHEESWNELGCSKERKAHSRLEGAFHVSEFLIGEGQLCHNAFCVAQKNFSVPGENDIPPAPFKERYAELRFERFHSSREGRLGNMQLLRSPGEMLLFRDFLEIR